MRQALCAEQILYEGRAGPEPGGAAAAEVAVGDSAILHLSLAATDCRCFGIYTVILLPLLSFSVQMTDSPLARLKG